MLFESLSLYKYQFIIELLISTGMFASKLHRRKYFIVRLMISLFVIACVVAFFPLVYNPWYISGMFLFFFLITLVGIFFCFKDSIWNVLFCGFAAYTVQHIAYLLNIMILDGITDQINNSYIINDMMIEVEMMPLIWCVYILVYYAVYVVSYFTCVCTIPKGTDLQLGTTSTIVISGVVIMIDIVFNMMTVYNTKADRLSIFLEYVYNLITCLFVLYVMFSKLRRKELERQYDVVQRVLSAEQQHYRRLKENMDIINVKCHDLKHQWENIRHSGKFDQEELRSVENAINIYQTIAKTGNEALDTVLTDKLLYCDNNNIATTCLADGECLSFMSDVDVYCLFANALDNAIEAVQKLPEDRRQIKLSIKNMGNVVSVRLENDFSGTVCLKDGFPLTTKDDKQYHGFGVLSMNMIVEKYGGKLKVGMQGDTFVLNIAFIKEELNSSSAV